MKKTFFSIFTLVFVFCFISLAVFATEGVAHHEVAEMNGKFYTIVADFVLLVLVLYFALARQAREFFSSRSLKIKMTMDESKKVFEEAHKRFEEIEKKLNNVEGEGRALIRQVTDQAELERKRLIVQAREAADKIRDDASRIASVELAKAKSELRAEAVELAANLAQQKIKSSLTNDDQLRLGQEFVGQVKKVVVS